jgi:hypothetical protein
VVGTCDLPLLRDDSSGLAIVVRASPSIHLVAIHHRHAGSHAAAVVGLKGAGEMWVRVTEPDRGDLAERVSERRHPGPPSATELESGDVVAGRDTPLGWRGVVPPLESDADVGPQRLAAVAVIVPLLTALMLGAWLWLR